MAANFWESSQYKQLLDQEEVDVVQPLDKERGISVEDFKLIKFHMSNHIMKLAQHIKVRQRVVATAITSGLGVPSCAVVSRVVLSCSIQYWMFIFFLRFQLIVRNCISLGWLENDSTIDDFVLSTLPSMFPHLVAVFIAACVSVTLSFAMFATLGLDSVLHRVCSVDLKDCFWSQVWAHVSWGLASVFPYSCCSLLPLLPLV
ncbi:hypothetical protein F2Q68_00036504 [Brassica cretica]|uniref:Uncharacterized protein n=1 Tax=Brassica cretica TaxID=69181 RepID=A0A8S9H6M5_BRACR|nr:hypothetical protein F2Q68_00036504 [Brassica cretica]